MKIVQINAVYGFGSTGKTTEQLHNYLLKKGHEAYVFWASKSTKSDDKILRIGSTLDHKAHALFSRIFNNQAFYSKGATRKLVKRLVKIQPDVVHLRNLHSNYINLPILFNYLKKNNIPVVITLHDCWFFTGGCFHFIYHDCKNYISNCINCPKYKGRSAKKQTERIFKKKSELYKGLDLTVIGVSKWVSECAKKSALFGENVNHNYVYNWIDLSVFNPCGDPNKLREKFNLKKDSKIVLGVAQSWSSSKGFEVFKKLSERADDNTEVVLVGNSGGRENTDKLKFIGRTENQAELAALYSMADVFVNPSPAETFGKVTAEAMACGAPVVAYNNTGTAEIVSSGCGYLVLDGDGDALIDKVLEVLSAEKGDVQGRLDFVNENFEIEKQLGKYEQIYLDLLKKREK